MKKKNSFHKKESPNKGHIGLSNLSMTPLSRLDFIKTPLSVHFVFLTVRV